MKNITLFGKGYQATVCGKILNKHGKELVSRMDKDGYLRVNLSSEGKVKTFRVHQLIADTYLSNSSKPQINHIDGNKQNNSASNLEYCTAKENVRHAFTILTQACMRKVVVNLSSGTTRKFKSVRACARFLGSNHGTLSNAFKMKQLPYTFTQGKLKGLTLISKG